MYCRAHKTATLTPIQHTVQQLQFVLVAIYALWTSSILMRWILNGTPHAWNALTVAWSWNRKFLATNEMG